MSTPEIQELQGQIKRLQGMVSLTGEHVMQLRLSEQKRDLGELDRREKELRETVPAVDAGKVTQEDVVQLVQELQGQLDMLDERSVRRVVNARAGPSTPIAPLPSTNNEYPPQFPATLAEFEALEKNALVALCQFYEMLPPDDTELEDMLNKVQLTADQAGVEVPQRQEPSEADLVQYYDHLARFLGLPSRRSATW